jgi:thiamine kinase-like enzyme
MTFSIQDTKLNDLISRIPVFENIKAVSPLGGGLTNINYRVDTANGTYVMRVSDSKSGVLGINRDNERANTIKAHEAGVGAAVIDSLIKENVLVISWIDAKTLHAEDIHKERSLLRRMAASLKKLHSGPAFQGEFYFPVIRKKYLRTVIDNNYFLPDQYNQLEPLVLELEKVLNENPEPFVPCNNDLLAENFMDDGEKIWIIDYEYSGQNEASFDIGNFASELFLNEEETTILCDAYWQEHLPAKIARAMAWSMIARFGWVLWASIQDAVSTINFDFRAWGLKKWNSVLPELQGEQYHKVLALLKQE